LTAGPLQLPNGPLASLNQLVAEFRLVVTCRVQDVSGLRIHHQQALHRGLKLPEIGQHLR
jgi:hypothetical protein